MSVFSKLVICVMIAAIVSSIALSLSGGHALYLPRFELNSFLLFALATCASAWLTSVTFKFKVSLPQLGAAREHGKVKWFNVSKGFGFITRASGEDIFVHFKSVRSSGGNRRGLREGQEVSFTVVDSEKGLQAEDVEAL